MKLLLPVILSALLVACAHHNPARVRCDARLVPVNAPAGERERFPNADDEASP